jgi:hypothetical protein
LICFEVLKQAPIPVTGPEFSYSWQLPLFPVLSVIPLFAENSLTQSRMSSKHRQQAIFTEYWFSLFFLSSESAPPKHFAGQRINVTMLHPWKFVFGHETTDWLPGPRYAGNQRSRVT